MSELPRWEVPLVFFNTLCCLSFKGWIKGALWLCFVLNAQRSHILHFGDGMWAKVCAWAAACSHRQEAVAFAWNGCEPALHSMCVLTSASRAHVLCTLFLLHHR